MARTSLAVAAATTLLGLAALTPSEALSASTKTCSSSGLSAKQVKRGVTYTVKVSKLRVSGGASCSDARSVARTAARSELRDNAIPTSVKGYSLSEPACDGGKCGPRTTVTATKGKAKIRFTMAGGA